MSSHAPAHISHTSTQAFESTPLHLKAASAAHHASSGAGGSILRTVIGLVIVIAVIYALTWIVRKLKSGDQPAAGDGLQRVASLPLGTGKSVALVRVGSELHLIGVADNGVTPIRSYSEDEAVEFGLPVDPPGTRSPAPRPGADITSQLSGALRAVKGSDQLSQTLDSLKRMTQR